MSASFTGREFIGACAGADKQTTMIRGVNQASGWGLSVSGEVWEGKAWERHVHSLLTIHHRGKGDDYQRVPDEHGGDLGLEGFSRSAQTVYQSYAPQEPLSVKQRYEKQRTKITTDIRKFLKNEKDIASLLGDSVRIKNWVLVVPVHDSKELVKHAAKKGAEVRKQKCCHVDNRHFQIVVKCRSDFPTEDAALAKSGASKIILTPPPDDAMAEKVLANAGAMVDRATAKLEGHIDVGVDDIIRTLLIALVRARNVVAEIGEDYPELARLIRDFDAAFEHRIKTESVLSVDEPRQRLRDVLELYRSGLLEVLPNLPAEHAEVMVTGKVGDLLERCPLHFAQRETQ